MVGMWGGEAGEGKEVGIGDEGESWHTRFLA